MITDHITLTIKSCPEDAPKYDTSFDILKITEAVVVGKGTENNNPTVDLQLVDRNGNKFLVMATGWIIESIAGAVTARRQLDQN